MNINIRGENISLTSSLQNYVEKKIGKLEKYFNSPLETDARVNLRVHNTDQVVEVTIPLQGLLMRAEESHDDMYAAIDSVTAKLERQLKKYKTKLTRKKRQVTRQAKHEVNDRLTAMAQTAVAEQTETDEAPEVVRTKRFVFKPMTVEEAILQMDMLGHSFFVFNSAETNATSVVYRRKDGRYGLIEPE